MRLKKRIQKEVLAEIAAECIANRVSLILGAKRKLILDSDGLGCSGYFDSEDRVLAVATQRPDWFVTLLHEYGHMCQWRDDPGGFDDDWDEYFWDWLVGEKELTQRQLRKAVNRVRGVELDCERRTVALISRHPELGIDIADYIRKANAYMYLYTVVAHRRKWVGMKRKPPYSVPEIVGRMPDELMRNYWELPKGYERLVVKHCF